jgi:predicted ferric reductase
MRSLLIWLAIATVVAIPIFVAANSPLLQWRDPIYIGAGFAGIVAMALLFVQPLAVGGFLPKLTPMQNRRAHRWIGGALVLAIFLHVAGLWITSPPDMVDALLLVAPTPFSFWGVIAMWAILAIAILALMRKRLRLRTWRKTHFALAAIIVISSVVHAILIQGTMGLISKILLCVFVVAAAIKVLGGYVKK